MTTTLTPADRRRILAATVLTLLVTAVMVFQGLSSAHAALPPLAGAEPEIGPVGPVRPTGPVLPSDPCGTTGCAEGAELAPVSPPDLGPLDPGPLDPCNAPIIPRECAPDGGASGPKLRHPGDEPDASDPGTPGDPRSPGGPGGGGPQGHGAPGVDAAVVATPTFTG